MRAVIKVGEITPVDGEAVGNDTLKGTLIGTSRRDFLGISALGLAAGVVANEAGAVVLRPTVSADADSDAAAAILAPDTDISVWVTAGDERFAAAPKAAWVASGMAPPDGHRRCRHRLWYHCHHCRQPAPAEGQQQEAPPVAVEAVPQSAWVVSGSAPSAAVVPESVAGSG